MRRIVTSDTYAFAAADPLDLPADLPLLPRGVASRGARPRGIRRGPPLGAVATAALQECPIELKATIDRWNKRWPGDRDGRDWARGQRWGRPRCRWGQP